MCECVYMCEHCRCCIDRELEYTLRAVCDTPTAAYIAIICDRELNCNRRAHSSTVNRTRIARADRQIYVCDFSINRNTI